MTATFSRAFKINIDTHMSSNSVGFQQDTRETLSNDTFEALKETDIPFIPYNLILDSIRNGCKIGQGAFGFVFKSHLLIEEERKTVAIKMLSESEAVSRDLKKEDLFKNEVEILSKYAFIYPYFKSYLVRFMYCMLLHYLRKSVLDLFLLI